jgi:hypothetical protein
MGGSIRYRLRTQVALAKHFDSGEGGSILTGAVHAAFRSLLACAFVACVTEPAREPPAVSEPTAASEAPAVSEAPAAQPSAPPAAGESAPPEAQAAPEGKDAPPTEEHPERVDPETGQVWPSSKPAGETRPVESAPASPTAAPQAAPQAAPTDTPESTSWLHGSFALRYRGRFSGDDNDQDARGVLSLDLADPRAPWIRGHLLARVDVDLEGLDGGEVFEDLSDTYDESVVTKLYLAYADVDLDTRPEESPGTLRVGRQSDPRLPEVLRLDGVSYLSRPLGKNEVELGAYGGVPAHLYESSSEGDRAYGTFVEGLPWHGGRARLDWMHLEDEEVLGEGRDDLVALGVWQDFPEHWHFEGAYSNLEGDPRDLRLRALYDSGDAETIVRAGYYELLETQTTRITELDPFTEQLLEYFPFREANLNVSQAVGAHSVVDAGFDLRRVSDAEDVGEFNREWERYYATATVNDLATEGLGLSVTVDRWDDDDRDTSSLGADLSYATKEHWKAGLGTYYSLYKYELLELDERDDVRTYYLRASRELTARLALDILYEFEDDDLDHYQTLRLGAVWRF